MQLNFHGRRQQKIRRGIQFGIAFLVLALAIAAVVTWMVVNYYTDQSRQPQEPEESAIFPPSATYTDQDKGELLVVFRHENTYTSLLVSADPAKEAMYTVPLSPSLTVDGKTTLSKVLIKNGPAKAVTLINEALSRSVEHYVLMTTDQVESFINTLESGVELTLPQAVTLTDENGAKRTLKKGKHTLTANQAAGVLKYNGWRKKSDKESVAAQLVAAMLNKHLTPGRYIAGDFASLCNLSQTDLRINHFSEWKERLTHLADSNKGGLCTIANDKT